MLEQQLLHVLRGQDDTVTLGPILEQTVENAGREAIILLSVRHISYQLPAVGIKLPNNHEAAMKALQDCSQSMCVSRLYSTQDITALLVRHRQCDPGDHVDLRVAVVGNVDAGKSTLLGVLTHGMLDDGRGGARTSIFRHKHEIESGRTSSIGNEIMGFRADGRPVVTIGETSDRPLAWTDICDKAVKVVSLIVRVI